MKRVDLKDGMRVVLRNNTVCVVIGGMLCFYNGWIGKIYGDYDESLCFINEDEWDIIKVFDVLSYGRIDNMLSLEILSKEIPIWIREEPKELTLAQVCKALGYTVKIIQ